MTAFELTEISASIGYAIGTLASLQDVHSDDTFKKQAIQRAIDGLRNIKLQECTTVQLGTQGCTCAEAKRKF